MGTQKFIKTQHFLISSLTDVKGSDATSFSYLLVYHLVPGKCDDPACVDLFGRHEEDAAVMAGGYYVDRSVLGPRGWKVADHQISLLWRQSFKADERINLDWVPAGLGQ